MKIIDSGLVFDAGSAPPDQRACFFTTMLRLSSGKILVGFRRGSTKYSADGNCCVTESSDDGHSWDVICDRFDDRFDGTAGEVRSVTLAEAHDGAVLACLARADRSKGDEYYSAESDTVCPTKILMTRSSDGGRTWNSSTLLDVGPGQCPVLSGPAVPIGSARWLITHERQEPEMDGGPSLHYASATLVGDDGKAEKVVLVARDPKDRLFYYDQRQAYCPRTNRLIAAYWTYDREAEKDIDIHLAHGDPAALEWEKPVGTGIAGQIAQPIPLPDGRLLLFYVHREIPCGMRLILSEDSGKTWETSGELVVYKKDDPRESDAQEGGDYAGMWVDMGKWSFGHPAGVVLDDGTVLLTYYAGPDETRLSIYWARVKL